MTEPLKAIMSTLLSLQGDQIDDKDINIAWRDSLPKDPREVAELARLEAGSNAIKPLVNAIMDNYDLDLTTAQQYVDAILEFQRQQAEMGAPEEDGREHGATGSTDTARRAHRRTQLRARIAAMTRMRNLSNNIRCCVLFLSKTVDLFWLLMYNISIRREHSALHPHQLLMDFIIEI